MNAESKQLQQGTPEWLAHRARHFNASEASAMLGLSSYKPRAELLREKATGIVPDVDPNTQARFDRGHEYEAAARPWAEEIIGAELYPMVFSAEVDGLPLSASTDGITMLEDVTWEHKTLNQDLAAALDSGHIPVEYWPQMEQGLILTRAEKCLFMASNGDKDTMRYAWYESKPEMRAKLLAGWKQFMEDVANYQHVEAPAEVVGATVEGLPALLVQVEGRVVATNLDAFHAAAQQFLARLPQASALESDQDFADADKAVKACKEAEERLSLVKDQAQAQAVDIDAVFRAMDQIGAQIRDARLALDKAVSKRKDDIRAGLVMQANKDLAEHIKKLNARLGGEWMPVIEGGFATSIKGKKTMAGLREAIGTAMANAKITANEVADTIERNAKRLDQEGLNFLFPDFKQVCTKGHEDFDNLLASRRQAHDERERERLAREEARKQAEEAARLQSDTAFRQQVEDQAKQRAATLTPTQETAAPDTGATMKLGDISGRLGFNVTADFLSSIGFDPVGQERAAKLYRQADFQRICMAMVRHIAKVGRLSIGGVA